MSLSALQSSTDLRTLRITLWITLFGGPDSGQTATEYGILHVIFKDCSEVLPSQELLEGPIHKIPLAVHVPMNLEGAVPKGRSQVQRPRVVSIESGIGLVGPEAWHSSDSSELSNCCQQSLAFLTTHFEVANCSTVTLPLAAESLAAKPLMSAVYCSG